MAKTIHGKGLYCLDLLCMNIRTFLKKHMHTIDVLFLIFYVSLQIIFSVAIFYFRNKGSEYLSFIVGLFMTLFLFLISFEAIILQFKSKQWQESKNEIEKQYYDLQVKYSSLSESNKELIKRNKLIMKLALKK